MLPRTWIEETIDDVRKQIDRDRYETDQQNTAQHRIHIGKEQCRCEALAKAGQANTVSISTVPSKKAINAVVEELVKQVAARSEKISVTRTGETVTVNGEIDVDALVMVVVGSMAGGP